MANGHGIFVEKEGSIFEGEWVNDKQHGIGKEVWPLGNITYFGDY